MKVKRRKVSKSNPEEVEISAEPDFEADVVVLQVGDQEVLLRAEDAADRLTGKHYDQFAEMRNLVLTYESICT